MEKAKKTMLRIQDFFPGSRIADLVSQIHHKTERCKINIFFLHYQMITVVNIHTKFSFLSYSNFFNENNVFYL
jgi:hypothetical protein